LSNNKVGDEGVKALVDALSTNHCLEGLYLGGTGISDEGAIAISAVLRNEGAISITDALSTNSSLKHLDLKNNIRISEQTRNVIASTIRADITFIH